MKMIKINSGEFLMGSEGWGEFESPIHSVKINSFLMDETLVTNTDFSEFVADTKYITDVEKIGASWSYKDGVYKMVPGLNWKSFATKDRSDHPVVLVSWNDATAYAMWTGKRLPTEAEWEFVCRSGLSQNLYPWGNDLPVGKCNWNQQPSEIPPTTPVKRFEPNEFGIYDMVGNTWQWIDDWYDAKYYEISLKENSTGPVEGKLKVRRGASFNIIQPFRLRCANRGAYDPKAFSINIGFRCAK